MDTTNAATALTRYERITARPRTALAYTATAIRCEIAAKTATGQTARKLLDRAEDCRCRADRARRAA